jgi:5-methylcytosine-specific restriction endonuclease McrA
MPSAIKTHKPPRLHAQQHRVVDRRQKRVMKLNGAAWRALRAQVLKVEPYCRVCLRIGWLSPAVEVDHINGDGNDNRLDNLQPLCRTHHGQKTRAEKKNRKQDSCQNRPPANARIVAK